MPRRVSYLAITLWVSLFACTLACAPDTETVLSECVPGQTTSCLCGDATVGVQTCAPDGTYASCSCANAPGGGDGNCTPEDCPCPDGQTGSRECRDGRLGLCECPTTPTGQFNECGGAETLELRPGTRCGVCDDGIRLCDGLNSVRCVGDSTRNVCGGCAYLRGALGDPCGPCGDGTLGCGGANRLTCLGARELNECGGCAMLTNRPSFTCTGPSGALGSYVCDTLDSTLCVGPGQNACGGVATLTETPGTPCGVCDDGRRICASPDAVVCLDADSGQNACGGCSQLLAEPGDLCGSCGGVWECDGTELLTCSSRLNACGGCSDLGSQPGSSCGTGEIYSCDGTDGVTCRSESDFNACGGRVSLADEPGSPCGACRDGQYVCAGSDTTVCVEDDREPNRCGGCMPLANVPGESCGANGRVWQCDGDDATACVIVNSGPTNYCGGVTTLPGIPGETCETCGRWVCDPNNPNLAFCLGGSPGLESDDDNCGMCGMRCLDKQVCSEGSCVTDRVVQIDSARGAFTAVRLASGAIESWGINQSTGPVGNGDLSNFIREPVRASLIDDAVDLATGLGVLGVTEARRGGTVCVIRGDASVWCWGDNREQQLGFDSSISNRSTVPVKVPGIENATDIAIGRGTVCAIRSDKTLWCWGNNAGGKRGSGSFSAPVAPTVVTGLTDVEQVVVTDVATCALDTDRDVYCWGSDAFGQLGDGSPETPATATPQRVTALENVDALAGAGNRFIARTATEVFQWGRTISGVNGRPQTSFAPVALNQSGTPVRVWASTDNLFVENPGGSIYMWGADNGRSGTDTGGFVTRQELGSIPGTANVQWIDGPFFGTMVLMDDGGVFTTGGTVGQGDDQLHTLTNAWSTRTFHPVPFYPPLASETGNCFDGVDNDRDGLLNCADPDCAMDVGSSEGTGAISDLVRFWYNYREATCAGVALREKFYRWTAPRSGNFIISSGLTQRETRIEVLEACATSAISLGCDDGDFSSSTTEVEFTAVGGQTYVFLVEVDPFGGPAVSLDINEVP